MRNTRTIFTALTLAALLAACGGSDDPTEPNEGGGTGGGSELGSFTGSSTGGIALSLAGSAIWGTASSGLAADGLELGLGAFTSTGAGGAPGSVIFWRVDESLPAVGDHQLFDLSSEEIPADDQFRGRAHLKAADGSHYYCDATAGTLHVTQASSTQIRGTFTMQATCARATVQEAVAVGIAGSFTAQKGLQTIPTGE